MRLKLYLDNLLPRAKRNFDLNDCDKILRIGSEEDINFPIINLLNIHQFDCDELEGNFKNDFKIKHMALINPHINFNGNAEEAFNFYKSVFGGEFTRIIRFKDLSNPELPIGEKEANKIMHIALPVGSSGLMGNDVPEFMGRTNENENRSKIAISAESREEADKLFSGLSVGGTVEMPIGDSPWGSYFGMFRDKYGIEWMVDFNPGSSEKADAKSNEQLIAAIQ